MAKIIQITKCVGKAIILRLDFCYLITHIEYDMHVKFLPYSVRCYNRNIVYTLFYMINTSGDVLNDLLIATP